MLLLGLCSCCLLPFVCLSCDVLGSVLSDLDVSVPSAMVHEHKPVLKHGAGTCGRASVLSLVKTAPGLMVVFLLPAGGIVAKSENCL